MDSDDKDDIKLQPVVIQVEYWNETCNCYNSCPIFLRFCFRISTHR